MKWTYLTAEDGNTTETGGTIVLQCVASLCASYVILPSPVDGGRSDAAPDKPAATPVDATNKF
jgi:hypothetical protein